MSYDLSVFRAVTAVDVRAATAVHTALCETRAPDESVVAADARTMDAAYRALVKKYPELDDDNEDESPWSAALTKTPHGLVLSMTHSMAGAVVPVVLAVAKKYGLTVYDPQTGAAYGPNDERPAAEEPRLPAKAAEKELATRIAETCAQAGFNPPKKKGKNATFVRTVASGLVQTFTIERANSKEVRLFLAIDDATLGPTIATAIGDDKPVRLVFTEFIGPFREADGTMTKETKAPDGRYAICHRSCLETNVKALERDLQSFAWPFFERTSTIAGVEDLYHSGGPSKRPAYLQFGMSDVPAFAFIGYALARHVDRKDLATWVDYYRAWIAEWGAPASRAQNVASFDAFVR